MSLAGMMASLTFASSLGISSSSAGTAIIVAIRNRRAVPFEALRGSTVSREFQIIHGSWTKRILHTLPPSAATAIIVIREETVPYMQSEMDAASLLSSHLEVAARVRRRFDFANSFSSLYRQLSL